MKIKYKIYNSIIIALMLITAGLNIVLYKQIVERNRILLEIENIIKVIEMKIK